MNNTNMYGQSKSKRLEIRLNDQEFSMIESMRIKNHLNISSLIRFLIKKYYEESINVSEKSKNRNEMEFNK
jgi:hypothetical protein